MPTSSTCTQCGRRCPASRLTALAADDQRCRRCLDHIPSAQRRAMLRKAAVR